MSRALVLGASGLVGGHLLERLLADATWDRVDVLGRRPLGREHPKLVERVIDFERLAEVGAGSGDDQPFAADCVFCCLGTTIKKVGGDRDAFRRVDFVYPFEAARLTSDHRGEKRDGVFLLVSALGANPKARTFYSRVKGEVEAAIARLPLGALHVFRPSLLLGDRQEPRPGEALAIGFSKALVLAMIGPLARFRPIAAADVAAAMAAVAARGEPGHHVYPSDRIARIARRSR